MPKDWTGNYHSVCGCLGAHNECNEEREVNDFYATEPRAAELLMEIEELDTNIWECACGEGHLAKPLIAAGHIVKATDLVDRGFGMGGGKFSRTDADVQRGHRYQPTLPLRAGVCGARAGTRARRPQGLHVPEGAVS